MNDDNGEQNMNLLLTIGAPPTDTDIIDQVPCNRGLITGQPGSLVQLTTNETVTIIETETHSLTMNLNASGEGAFRFYSHHAEVSSVALVNIDTGDIKTGTAIFNDYQAGDGDISILGSTSGAAANGEMPCSIYLVTNPATLIDNRIDITSVRVTIVDSTTAQIVGYPNQSSAIIPLKSDKSAEVDITNTEAESVTIQLTLPESSGTEMRVKMIFIATA